MNIQFEKMKSKKNAPMDLLLLADPSEEQVRKYLDPGICYIARFNGDIIGIAVVIETNPETLEIMNVAIKEEFQNMGVGKKLLLFVIEEIKKTNTKYLEIGTGNPGVIQMLLYQKCGFRIVGIDFDYFRKKYPERIYENGIECRDMIRMRMEF